MHPETIPDSFVNYGNLESLIEILLGKEELRKSLDCSDFGKRVKSLDEAEDLLDSVARVAHGVLHLGAVCPVKPVLVLSAELKKLPVMTIKLYVLFLPISILLLYLAFSAPARLAGLPVALVAILFVLATPYLVARRTRLNLEHSAKYIRKQDGQSIIVLDQLPRVQFQSFLAHEYAHHLYYELGGRTDEAWLREGWARLVQWHVVRELSQSEQNPAFEYHALLQIIGELKFATVLLAKILFYRLPKKVKRIRTIYHANPLYRLLTGTPGFDWRSLTRHAVGTASSFLAEARHGVDYALREPLEAKDPSKQIS